MSTANNNSAAYAFRTDMPSVDFALLFWHKASSGVVNNTNYSQLFEVAYGSGNYFQLYSPQFDGTPELRYYRAEVFDDNQIINSATYVGAWIRFALTRVGTTYTMYYAAIGATSWTEIDSWINATAPTSICFMAGYLDIGDYLMPGASIRSARLYTDSHSMASLITDSESATPTLSGLWAAWFDGATASLDGSDSSGNSRALTVVGTFVEDTDDPIEAGGSTETLEVTGASASASPGTATSRLVVSATGASANTSPGTASTRFALAVSGAACSSAAGSAAQRLTLSASGATCAASAGDAFSSQTLAVTGTSAEASAGSADLRAVTRISVTGSACSASPGTASTTLALAATGASCTATGGDASLDTGNTLPITGAACVASAGNIFLRTTSRLDVTGASCSASAGQAYVRQVSVLIATGSSATVSAGTSQYVLDLRATGASCTASAGTASRQGGDVAWETSFAVLHAARLASALRAAAITADIREENPLRANAHLAAISAKTRTPVLTLDIQ